jgi:hypothetical protein
MRELALLDVEGAVDGEREAVHAVQRQVHLHRRHLQEQIPEQILTVDAHAVRGNVRCPFTISF